jgi:hypothetical protein
MTPFRFGSAICGGLVGLSVWFASTATQAQVALRWKFQPGQTYTQVMKQELSTSAMIGPQVVDTKIVQTLDARWRVRSVNDEGVAEIDQEFDRLQLSMQGVGGLSIDFDSKAAEPAAGIVRLVAPALKAIANSKFKSKINSRGEIMDIQLQEQPGNAIQAIPGLGQLITKESLISMIKGSLYSLPATAVAPGDSWTSKVEHQLPQIGKMIEEFQLTYVGPETVDGKLLHRVDLAVNTRIPVDPAKVADVKFSIKEQMTKGALFFDQEAGVMDRFERASKMVIDVQAQGQVFSQTTNQTMTAQFELMPPQ